MLTHLLATLIAGIIICALFASYTMFWAALISVTSAFWGYPVTKGAAVMLGMFVVLCRATQKAGDA